MAKKGKLPKRIAGVKIPKKLRKRGGPLYALMENPMVRNVVADLLAVGLLAAADRISKQPKVKKTGKEAKSAAADTAEAAEFIDGLAERLEVLAADLKTRVRAGAGAKVS